MAAQNLGILSAPIFQQVILPFSLIFVVIFAILQRIKVLGDSRQINAIVAFIFAIIFTSVSYATGFVAKIIPITGAIIIVLLVFMLMWGFIGGNVAPLNKGLRIAGAILITIALVIMIMWATGTLSWITKVSWANTFFSSLVLIIFIIAVFAVVLTSGPPVPSHTG